MAISRGRGSAELSDGAASADSRYRWDIFRFCFFVNEATREITVAKLPSTPDDPSKAILAGVETLVARGVAPHDIRYFCHGTTVGTNALLEGKGVRTGLLVTKRIPRHLRSSRAIATLRPGDL